MTGPGECIGGEVIVGFLCATGGKAGTGIKFLYVGAGGGKWGSITIGAGAVDGTSLWEYGGGGWFI